MNPDKEKEVQIAEYFLKSFDEISPLDYDILDSMFTEKNSENLQISKN
jgi:hypothetical protein